METAKPEGPKSKTRRTERGGVIGGRDVPLHTKLKEPEGEL